MLFTGKFLAVFFALYLGTLAIIGLAAPGGHYSPFVQQHLDYVSWIKMSLIHATQSLLSLFGYKTQAAPGFTVRLSGGRGVFIAMDCVGYGVYSFWIAFVAANRGSFFYKLGWIIFGVPMLWLINVVRISLFLLSINKGWQMPLGMDHHTWFNIAAYGFIFLLIWLYSRQQIPNTKVHAKNTA